MKNGLASLLKTGLEKETTMSIEHRLSKERDKD